MTARHRNKTLSDFAEILEWILQSKLETVTIIGGIAVGAYAQEAGETAFSADLDLLMTTEEQRWFGRETSKLRQVRVCKTPQPRTLGVLVLEWNELEVNVLTQSPGLPTPESTRGRAWMICKYPVASPFDLLSNKIEVNREKDQDHIKLLRGFCEDLALECFVTRPGRDATRFMKRLLEVEQSRTFRPELMDEFIQRAGATSTQGRKFLATASTSKDQRRRIVERAPPGEREDLLKMMESLESRA